MDRWLLTLTTEQRDSVLALVNQAAFKGEVAEKIVVLKQALQGIPFTEQMEIALMEHVPQDGKP